MDYLVLRVRDLRVSRGSPSDLRISAALRFMNFFCAKEKEYLCVSAALRFHRQRQNAGEGSFAGEQRVEHRSLVGNWHQVRGWQLERRQLLRLCLV